MTQNGGSLMEMTDKLSFRTKEPQYYLDGWRSRVRLCEYKGHCPVCGRTMYHFEDGENDPRGPLGDHAATFLSPRGLGVSSPRNPLTFWYCFLCSNDQQAYNRAVQLAKIIWTGVV